MKKFAISDKADVKFVDITGETVFESVGYLKDLDENKHNIISWMSDLGEVRVGIDKSDKEFNTFIENFKKGETKSFSIENNG